MSDPLRIANRASWFLDPADDRSIGMIGLAKQTAARGSNKVTLIVFIEHGGTEHAVDVDAGLSLMEAALANAIPGIDADCGGACACATCHCIVDPAWFTRLAPALPAEADMLDYLDLRQPTSRLSCQVSVAEELDGMIVRLPKSQQ